MAVYDKQTKFYYLQVKEDFFDDDAIAWLEDRDNGEKYSNFYLKLCLKSLKTNGLLIKRVGTMLIPYDYEALRKLTGVKDIDTVKVAMDLLIKSGLVQITEEHAIYISQLENLIGSKSLGALKKQQQLERKRQKELGGGTGVENLPPNINIELELKKDINIEVEQVETEETTSASDSINLFTFLESNFARTISPIETEQLFDWQKDFNDEIIKYAITLCCNANAKNLNYLNAILNNWKSKGFTKIEECKNENMERNNKPTNTYNKPIRQEVVPDWFNKQIESKKSTEEERKEMEDLLKEYQNP